jgi:glucokinase
MRIGIDVGGTKIAAGVVAPHGCRVVFRRVIPTLPARGGEAVLEDVLGLARELDASVRATGGATGGIGVGLCEIVDRAGRPVSGACIDWRGLDPAGRLASVAPAIIEADVRAAARAEAVHGAGRGAEVFVYVSVGTGISSCLVVDGEPFPGALGAAGTLATGPLPAFHDGDTPPAAPSIEELASGPALVRRFNALGGAALTGHDVLAAALAGDPRALRVVDSGAAVLGAAIGWIVNVLDPGRVVLGGGLGLGDGPYRRALLDALRRHVWWTGHREIPVLSAETGPDAGILGAALAAGRPKSG